MSLSLPSSPQTASSARSFLPFLVHSLQHFRRSANSPPLPGNFPELSPANIPAIPHTRKTLPESAATSARSSSRSSSPPPKAPREKSANRSSTKKVRFSANPKIGTTWWFESRPSNLRIRQSGESELICATCTASRSSWSLRSASQAAQTSCRSRLCAAIAKASWDSNREASFAPRGLRRRRSSH